VVVTEVTPGLRGRIGLKPGHVVEELWVGDFGPAVKIDAAGMANLLPKLDAESPTKFFSIIARMPGQPPGTFRPGHQA